MKTPRSQKEGSHEDEDRKPSAASVAEGAKLKGRDATDLEGKFATASSSHATTSSFSANGDSTTAIDGYSLHFPTTSKSISSNNKRKFLTFEEAHASIKRLSHEELLRASKQALKQHLEVQKQKRRQVDHLQAIVLQERLQEKAHMLAKENPSLSETLFQLSSLAAGLGRKTQASSSTHAFINTNSKIPTPTRTASASAEVGKEPIALVRGKGASNRGNCDNDAVAFSASSGHPLEEKSIRLCQKKKVANGMECGSSGSSSYEKKTSAEGTSSYGTGEGGSETTSASGQLSSEEGEGGASSSGQASSEGGEGGGISSSTFSTSTQTHSSSVSTDQAVYCNTQTNISDHRVPPFASSLSSPSFFSTSMQHSKQYDFRRQWQQMLELRPDSTDVKGITEWLLRLFDLATLSAASEAMILPDAETSSSPTTSSSGSSVNGHEKKSMAAATTTKTKSTVRTNDKDFIHQELKRSPTTNKSKRKRREE